MSPDTVIVAALETVEALAGKVFPLEAPKNTAAPFVIYLRGSAEEAQSLDGGVGLYRALFEINVVAGSYAQLSTAGDAARAALLGLWDSESGGYRIERVTVEQSSPDLWESEVQLYRRSYNLNINYQITSEEE